ncbi:hypothetical protein JYT90_00705, partial [bacterium AH-315-P07]|nr:hypothetical protein [bacterium AH-315-P07]MBN4046816.1 hypothetical protein [bacterium AH-315-P07]
HQSISPMVNTAAATCHPVIAANEMRVEQCLDAKLVPEFTPHRLEKSEDVVDSDISFSAIYIAQEDSLPDHLIIMDTPDVDSIDKRNWEVADHIRAAGDVLVAVVTGEKYKDHRVIQYFKEAAESGRMLIPVMNKANPAEDFDVARKQLEEFCSDVGIEAHCFVIAHDFEIGEDVSRCIESLEEDIDLRAYLEGLNVSEIKKEVFGQTVERFIETTAGFLDHVSDVGDDLRDKIEHFEDLAESASFEYEPAPGKEVGGLFHEFVQSKRGTIRRYIGSTSAAIVRGAAGLGRSIASGFQKRTTLDTEDGAETDESLVKFHRDAIERIARNLTRRYIEISRSMPEPAATIIGDAVDELDMDAAVDAIVADTLVSENISDEFREHAELMMSEWWKDNTGKRMTLEALDTVLAIMPAAIAGVVGIATHGFGAGEVALASTAAGAAFGAKVMEYQFGDALFDFLSPWVKEQQVLLNEALLAHLTRPCLGDLYEALEPFDGDVLDDLRRHHARCMSIEEATES